MGSRALRALLSAWLTKLPWMLVFSFLRYYNPDHLICKADSMQRVFFYRVVSNARHRIDVVRQGPYGPLRSIANRILCLHGRALAV